MTASLTFYTHPMSRARTVRWMLEECGGPYDTVQLEFGTSMKAPAYLAINPMGKVPALKHGDTVITEVAAICAYLADLFPEKNLAPPLGSAERGSYYRWLFFVAGPLDAIITAKALNLMPPPDKAIMVGYGSYTDVMNTLEAAVSRGHYLCGDAFTAADLVLAAYLNWGMQTGGIEKRAAFERYSQPIVQRPACVRAAAMDDALLPKPGASS